MTRIVPPLLLALSIMASMASSGCRFDYLHDDLDRMRRMSEVTGELTVEEWTGAPILVALLLEPEQPSDPIRVVRSVYLPEPGSFAFRVEAGKYILVALEDQNRNEQVDDGERGAALPPFRLGERDNLAGRDIHVGGLFPRRPIDERTVVQDERPYRTGELAPLEHERFSQAAGVLGLWQPLRMMDRYLAGLWLLGPYDPHKTPVVFVHGMGGYSQEFQTMIEALDTERFQPWVYMYPSGLRLESVAQYLSEALTELHATHGFDHTCLVAHSMGGVVTRRALTHHVAANPEPFVRGFVTIASPLGGIASAESGVDMAPEVVPAWHDLVPEGGFMRALYRQPLPASIEYQLLFTYEASGPDDGVVPIQSQLRRDAQREAEVVRGFEASHTGALSHDRVIRQVELALDRCRGDRPGAPLVADRSMRPRSPTPPPPAATEAGAAEPSETAPPADDP